MSHAHKPTITKLGRPDSASHAVLLYGPKGAGQEVASRQLAQHWLCQQPAGEGACGECAACLAYSRGNAMDLLEISPRGKSDQIRVQAIEPPKPGDPVDPDVGPPMLNFITTAPIRSPFKVVRIERIERMSNTVYNSILKALEEPPPRVRYVLTSDDLGHVPATILSRCVCMCFGLPDDTDLADLSEMEKIFSEGAPGMVDRIRSQDEAYRQLMSVLESTRASTPLEALRAAERFRECGDAFSEALWGSQRAINAELVRCLALWLRHAYPHATTVQRRVIEVHKRVIGNANFALQTDPLFCFFFANR